MAEFVDMPSKFMSYDMNIEGAPHDYGNVYYRVPAGNRERLVIGPSRNHVDLLLALAKTFPTQEFYVLYVLLVSKTGADQGRYQSPLFESHKELEDFFLKFRDFFEGDGRHHIWIGTPSNEGLLVYDRHNVIYAYGPLAAYTHILASRGFLEQEFSFPVPHGHGYPASGQPEQELFQYCQWQHHPLNSADEA
ncbi:MAG: hypothetical protein ACK4NQ_08945 [Fimbriimonadaceae bacterium]